MDEEEWGGVWWFRRSDMAFLQLFIEEFHKGFSFHKGQWVNFTIEGFWGIGK